MEIDYSAVDGKVFTCPPGCGMCCLCQPEILPRERVFFRKHHPKAMVRSRISRDGFSIALKKGRGSCVFLNDRKCDIYHDRPTFCRQFPFHFYAGDRVSVEPDYSCRGLWVQDGMDASTEARALAKRSLERITSAFDQSKAVYAEFQSICEDAGIWEKPEDVRKHVADNMRLFRDPVSLAEAMSQSLGETKADLYGIKPSGDGDILEEAREAALGSMSSSDPFESPVYTGRDWSWNLFSIEDGDVRWNILDDAGDLHHQKTIAVDEVRIPKLDNEASDLLQWYVSVLNSRESFLGSAYYNVDDMGYEEYMLNVYVGTLSVSVADLLWRAGLLAEVTGLKGADLVREAIIFYDMDRLDSPTIGGFA